MSDSTIKRLASEITEGAYEQFKSDFESSFMTPVADNDQRDWSSIDKINDELKDTTRQIALGDQTTHGHGKVTINGGTCTYHRTVTIVERQGDSESEAFSFSVVWSETQD